MIETEIKEKLQGIVLSNGTTAEDYVEGLPEKYREVATQAILNCLEKGYHLNDMMITQEGRAINRKKLGLV